MWHDYYHHLLLMLQVLLLVLLFNFDGQREIVVSAVCPDSADYNPLVVACYAALNRSECMTSRGYCDGPGSPAVEFSNCSSTLEVVMSNTKGLDCVQLLASTDTSGLSSTAKTQKAGEYCNLTYTEFLNEMCSPLGDCPSDSSDLLLLTALATCLLPNDLTTAQLDTYNPYACLQEQENTVSTPSVCQEDNALYSFTTCQEDTYTVINVILKLNTTSTTSCNDLLKGPVLNPYCSERFGQALINFCKAPLCNQAVYNFPMCDFIGVVSAVGFVFILGIILLCVCYCRRKRSKKQNYVNVPEDANKKNELAKQGSFGQLNQNAPQMLHQGSFNTSQQSQQQPAFFVTMHNIQNSPPMAAIVAAPPSPPLTESDEARHRRQLLEFYKFHDPDRPDTESHVDKLLAKYDFKSIAKALKSKYGMLPPGWDEELAKPVKVKKGGGGTTTTTLGTDESSETKLPNNAPKFQKYNQMAKLGVSEAAIIQAMEREGVDPSGWVYAP